LTRAFKILPPAPRFARNAGILVVVCGLALLLLLLAAFGVTGGTSIFGTAPPSHGTPGVIVKPKVILAHSKPGVGPKVILTLTPVSGNVQGQLVTLPDRTLVISNVSKVAGTNSSSTGISVTISVKNTGSKSIANNASFFQLIATEGDTFGLLSSTNASFFRDIARQTSRKDTLVFQVPTAALGGIRLLFRSEIAAETVFIPLNT
jgi:hypothetical protein